MFMHASMCMYVCMYACFYVCMYLGIYVCIYIYRGQFLKLLFFVDKKRH